MTTTPRKFGWRHYGMESTDIRGEPWMVEVRYDRTGPIGRRWVVRGRTRAGLVDERASSRAVALHIARLSLSACPEGL